MLDLQTFLPTLDAKVKKVFSPYEGYGYQRVETKIDASKALGSYLESRILASSISREISVSYFLQGKSKHGTLVVHLQNGSGDSFKVVDGMRVKGASEAERLQLALHTLNGETIERIDSALASAKLSLDKYLLEVVKGNEWFHIPTNWGNTR
jgi:hypothetical protein